MRRIPIGHGYVLAPRCTGYESVRKARKSYECEGALIDADSVADGVGLSPGTGSIVGEGRSDSCAQTISSGDLYVALEFEGEHAQDLGADYRYTFRTCLACALSFDTVRLDDHSKTKARDRS